MDKSEFVNKIIQFIQECEYSSLIYLLQDNGKQVIPLLDNSDLLTIRECLNSEIQRSFISEQFYTVVLEYKPTVEDLQEVEKLLNRIVSIAPHYEALEGLLIHFSVVLLYLFFFG